MRGDGGAEDSNPVKVYGQYNNVFEALSSTFCVDMHLAMCYQKMIGVWGTHDGGI